MAVFKKAKTLDGILGVFTKTQAELEAFIGDSVAKLQANDVEQAKLEQAIDTIEQKSTGINMDIGRAQEVKAKIAALIG